jgi:phenylalanyl-tRNA synthetase alpha chain
LIAGLPADARKEAGAALNRAKAELEALLADKAAGLAGQPGAREGIDVTLPGRRVARGRIHPVSLAFREIMGILRGLGFEAADGPEVETEYYNFTVLNTPADHPARDMQDTYYLPDGTLLRTHTSAVWAHVMEKRPPPLRIACPGRTFRRDAADASHSPMFHQVEGLWVDDRCSFADLKGMLSAFLVSYFGEGTRVRFDPRYFPFTEPSTEVSIECSSCRGKGCGTCGRTGWLELLGAGMVHPKILELVGGPYHAKGLRGFAFGMGVERLAMMKYRITDMRWIYDNDLRIAAQFAG